MPAADGNKGASKGKRRVRVKPPGDRNKTPAKAPAYKPPKTRTDPKPRGRKAAPSIRDSATTNRPATRVKVPKGDAAGGYRKDTSGKGSRVPMPKGDRQTGGRTPVRPPLRPYSPKREVRPPGGEVTGGGYDRNLHHPKQSTTRAKAPGDAGIRRAASNSGARRDDTAYNKGHDKVVVARAKNLADPKRTVLRKNVTVVRDEKGDADDKSERITQILRFRNEQQAKAYDDRKKTKLRMRSQAIERAALQGGGTGRTQQDNPAKKGSGLTRKERNAIFRDQKRRGEQAAQRDYESAIVTGRTKTQQDRRDQRLADKMRAEDAARAAAAKAHKEGAKEARKRAEKAQREVAASDKAINEGKEPPKKAKAPSRLEAMRADAKKGEGLSDSQLAQIGADKKDGRSPIGQLGRNAGRDAEDIVRGLIPGMVETAKTAAGAAELAVGAGEQEDKDRVNAMVKGAKESFVGELAQASVNAMGGRGDKAVEHLAAAGKEGYKRPVSALLGVGGVTSIGGRLASVGAATGRNAVKAKGVQKVNPKSIARQGRIDRARPELRVTAPHHTNPKPSKKAMKEARALERDRRAGKAAPEPATVRLASSGPRSYSKNILTRQAQKARENRKAKSSDPLEARGRKAARLQKRSARGELRNAEIAGIKLRGGVGGDTETRKARRKVEADDHKLLVKNLLATRRVDPADPEAGLARLIETLEAHTKGKQTRPLRNLKALQGSMVALVSDSDVKRVAAYDAKHSTWVRRQLQQANYFQNEDGPEFIERQQPLAAQGLIQKTDEQDIADANAAAGPDGPLTDPGSDTPSPGDDGPPSAPSAPSGGLSGKIIGSNRAFRVRPRSAAQAAPVVSQTPVEGGNTPTPTASAPATALAAPGAPGEGIDLTAPLPIVRTPGNVQRPRTYTDEDWDKLTDEKKLAHQQRVIAFNAEWGPRNPTAKPKPKAKGDKPAGTGPRSGELLRRAGIEQEKINEALTKARAEITPEVAGRRKEFHERLMKLQNKSKIKGVHPLRERAQALQDWEIYARAFGDQEIEVVPMRHGKATVRTVREHYEIERERFIRALHRAETGEALPSGPVPGSEIPFGHGLGAEHVAKRLPPAYAARAKARADDRLLYEALRLTKEGKLIRNGSPLAEKLQKVGNGRVFVDFEAAVARTGKDDPLTGQMQALSRAKADTQKTLEAVQEDVDMLERVERSINPEDLEAITKRHQQEAGRSDAHTEALMSDLRHEMPKRKRSDDTSTLRGGEGPKGSTAQVQRDQNARGKGSVLPEYRMLPEEVIRAGVDHPAHPDHDHAGQPLPRLANGREMTQANARELAKEMRDLHKQARDRLAGSPNSVVLQRLVDKLELAVRKADEDVLIAHFIEASRAKHAHEQGLVTEPRQSGNDRAINRALRDGDELIIELKDDPGEFGVRARELAAIKDQAKRAENRVASKQRNLNKAYEDVKAAITTRHEVRALDRDDPSKARKVREADAALKAANAEVAKITAQRDKWKAKEADLKAKVSEAASALALDARAAGVAVGKDYEALAARFDDARDVSDRDLAAKHTEEDLQAWVDALDEEIQAREAKAWAQLAQRPETPQERATRAEMAKRQASMDKSSQRIATAQAVLADATSTSRQLEKAADTLAERRAHIKQLQAANQRDQATIDRGRKSPEAMRQAAGPEYAQRVAELQRYERVLSRKRDGEFDRPTQAPPAPPATPKSEDAALAESMGAQDIDDGLLGLEDTPDTPDTPDAPEGDVSLGLLEGHPDNPEPPAGTAEHLQHVMARADDGEMRQPLVEFFTKALSVHTPDPEATGSQKGVQTRRRNVHLRKLDARLDELDIDSNDFREAGAGAMWEVSQMKIAGAKIPDMPALEKWADKHPELAAAMQRVIGGGDSMWDDQPGKMWLMDPQGRKVLPLNKVWAGGDPEQHALLTRERIAKMEEALGVNPDDPIGFMRAIERRQSNAANAGTQREAGTGDRLLDAIEQPHEGDRLLGTTRENVATLINLQLLQRVTDRFAYHETPGQSTPTIYPSKAHADSVVRRISHLGEWEPRLMREGRKGDDGKTSGEQWVVMPRSVNQELDAHFTSFANRSATARSIDIINRSFIRAVLPFSATWALGNIIDQGVRGALATHPMDFARGRTHWKALDDALRATPEGRKIADLVTAPLLGHFEGRKLMRRTTFADVADATESAALKRLTLAIHGDGKRGGRLREVTNDGIDGIFDRVSRAERIMVQRNAGAVAADMARDLGFQHNVTEASGQFARLAARFAKDPHALLEFQRRVLEVNGDFISRGITGDGTQRLVPFINWIREANKFVWKTLPVRHPLRASLMLQMVLATEEARAQLGYNYLLSEAEAKGEYGIAKRRGFDAGTISVAGLKVPVSPYTSFGEAQRLFRVTDELARADSLAGAHGLGKATVGEFMPWLTKPAMGAVRAGHDDGIKEAPIALASGASRALVPGVGNTFAAIETGVAGDAPEPHSLPARPRVYFPKSKDPERDKGRTGKVVARAIGLTAPDSDRDAKRRVRVKPSTDQSPEAQRRRIRQLRGR